MNRGYLGTEYNYRVIRGEILAVSWKYMTFVLCRCLVITLLFISVVGRMSSPEVEKFEITEDDLANEFYPRGGRRQTKNQAIYGKFMEFSLFD